LKTIVFNDEINTETISNLLVEIETLEPNETAYEIDGNVVYKRNIYFSSPGGSVSDAAILIDYINTSTEFVFELIGTWNLSSSGFNIFTLARCKKRLIEKTNNFAVIHLFDRDVSTRDLKKKKSFERFMNSEMEKQNEKILDWYEQIGVTEDQLTEIRAGEDVLIDNQQLTEIIENSNRIHLDYLKKISNKPCKKKKKSVLSKEKQETPVG
jgi:ATP-dependent protease ClpP protease subunit